MELMDMDRIDQIWNELNNPIKDKKIGSIDCFPSNDKKVKRSIHNFSKATSNQKQNYLPDRCQRDAEKHSKVILEFISLISVPEKGELDKEGSDDDSDRSIDESNTASIAANTNSRKVQRILKCLRSQLRNDRYTCLLGIEMSIQYLSQDVERVPLLEFSPPYDINSVTLKCQTNLISDLAREAWPHWEKSQELLSSQFHSIEVNGKRKNGQSVTEKQLQVMYDVFGGELCHRLRDESEQCRQVAIRCFCQFSLIGIHLEKYFHSLMREIISKFKPVSYDESLNVFVYDHADNNLFKRGGATHRQDRSRLLHGESLILMNEISEEIRFEICQLISSVVRCSVAIDCLDSLDSYFVDMLLAVQSLLSDPFPELKITSAQLLVQLLRIPQWECVAKHFAVALARAAIPNMRHRNARVRHTAIDLFGASVAVPDRAKFKGAGSEAIFDILGYQEENILPIAAFYKSECAVTVNVLAELSMDRNLSVRFRCCQLLRFLLTTLPNRHDFHQHILPYMLAFHNDDSPNIRECALSTVLHCGRQYETEHPDMVIERKQFGVDGDTHCNQIDPLPPPFDSRPSLGARLFVRESTRRILEGVLKELSNWVENVRLASSKLLKILIIYNEEHLTMNFHKTLEDLTKGLQLCLREKLVDSDLYARSLNENIKLIGRFIDPQLYLNLLLPRVLADAVSGTSFCDGGFHPEISRVAYAIALARLMEGTSIHRISPYMRPITESLLSEATIGKYSGLRVQTECLTIIFNTLNRYHEVGLNLFASTDLSGEMMSAVSLNQIISRLVAILDEKGNDRNLGLLGVIKCIKQEIGDSVHFHRDKSSLFRKKEKLYSL